MEFGKFLLFLLLAFTSGVRADDDDDEDSSEEEINYRLNNYVIPIHYDIEIKPYLESPGKEREQFTFDGVTKITIRATKSNVKEIVLHAQNLTITGTQLTQAGYATKRILVRVSEPDPITDKITIFLTRPMIRGINYQLAFEYSGFINSKPIGFHRLSYEDKDGEIAWVAATNLDPSHARIVFPCFDEPGFKTTFTVQINRSNKYHIYSNTILNYSIALEGEDRTIDVFTKTPKMSTYNLAFVVTEFDEQKPASEVNYLAEEKYSGSMEKTYDIILTIIKYLERYTGIPLGVIDLVKKFDIVGLPHDDVSPRLNWGILTLDDEIFECDDKCLDLEKERISLELANALAQIWFGNLVTSNWWSCTWLTEGFTNYLKYLALSEVVPDWNAEDKMYRKSLFKALKMDPYQDHPLTGVSINSPEDIQEIENLAKEKGPAIINMLNHMFGEESFRRAVRKFLSQNSYDNVEPKDLIEVLNEEWENEDVNFEELFYDWTGQKSFPLVQIDVAENGKSFVATQKPFPIYEEKNITSKWIIPITYTTDDEKDFEETLPSYYLGKEEPLTVPLNEPADWVIVNIRHTGYYRVNYDNENWIKIGNALKSDDFGGIHYLNRAQIVRDLLKNGETGNVEYKYVLEILKYLEDETSPAVWELFFEFFPEVSNGLMDDDYEKMQMYLRPIFQKQFRNLEYDAFDDQTEFKLEHLEDNLKAQMFAMSCMMRVEECIEKAMASTDDYVKNNKKFLTDKIELAFAVAINENYDKYFDVLFKILKAQNPEHVFAAACTSDNAQLIQVMEFIIESEDVGNEFEQFDFMIHADCVNKEALADFVLGRFSQIVKGNETAANNLIVDLAEHINTEEKYARYEEIIDREYEDIVLTERSKTNAKNWGREAIDRYKYYYIPSLRDYLSENFRMKPKVAGRLGHSKKMTYSKKDNHKNGDDNNNNNGNDDDSDSSDDNGSSDDELDTTNKYSLTQMFMIMKQKVLSFDE